MTFDTIMYQITELRQLIRDDDNLDNLPFIFSDRDGRTIQNEIEYRGNPDRLRGLFG